MNFGPRAGFAWTLNDAETTVVRGGIGFLYSPHLIATVRQSVGESVYPVPNRLQPDRKRLERGQVALVHRRHEQVRAGRRWWQAIGLLGLRSGDRKPVYDSGDAERSAFAGSLACGRSRVHPHRRPRLPAAAAVYAGFDRVTGARPNPSLGAPGGYYVDSSQTMAYNGLQTSVRKRFSNRYSWDVNYTVQQERRDAGRRPVRVLHRRVREQPGLLGSRIRPRAIEQRYPASVQWLVHLRGPGHQRWPGRCERHSRRVADFRHRPGRSGNALLITQPSGISRSRPDVVPGEELIVADWKDTCTAAGCNYLNTAGFVSSAQ